MTMTPEAARRRAAIRRFANRFKDQPLKDHVLTHEVFVATGIRTTDATVRRDMRAIIDASPKLYFLRRGALVRTDAFAT